MEALRVEKGLEALSDPASHPVQEQQVPQQPWTLVSLCLHTSRDRRSGPPNAVPSSVGKLSV